TVAELQGADKVVGVRERVAAEAPVRFTTPIVHVVDTDRTPCVFHTITVDYRHGDLYVAWCLGWPHVEAAGAIEDQVAVQGGGPESPRSPLPVQVAGEIAAHIPVQSLGQLRIRPC